MDLLVIIVALAAVWLVSALLCLGLCASAARGDRALRPPAARRQADARLRPLERGRRVARGIRPAA